MKCRFNLNKIDWSSRLLNYSFEDVFFKWILDLSTMEVLCLKRAFHCPLERRLPKSVQLPSSHCTLEAIDYKRCLLWLVLGADCSKYRRQELAFHRVLQSPGKASWRKQKRMPAKQLLELFCWARKLKTYLWHSLWQFDSNFRCFHWTRTKLPKLKQAKPDRRWKMQEPLCRWHETLASWHGHAKSEKNQRFNWNLINFSYFFDSFSELLGIFCRNKKHTHTKGSNHHEVRCKLSKSVENIIVIQSILELTFERQKQVQSIQKRGTHSNQWHNEDDQSKKITELF